MLTTFVDMSNILKTSLFITNHNDNLIIFRYKYIVNHFLIQAYFFFIRKNQVNYFS